MIVTEIHLVLDHTLSHLYYIIVIAMGCPQHQDVISAASASMHVLEMVRSAQGVLMCNVKDEESGGSKMVSSLQKIDIGSICNEVLTWSLRSLQESLLTMIWKLNISGIYRL